MNWVAAFIFGALLGSILGMTYENADMKAQAIDNDCAEYNGLGEFVWLNGFDYE